MSRDTTAAPSLISDQSNEFWSVSDDPVTGALVARLPGYITVDIAAATTAEVANRLAERGKPTVVRLDLHDVADQDPATPLIAMKGILSVLHLIERIDLIVVHQSIRVAAVTAAQILRLKLTVRSER